MTVARVSTKGQIVIPQDVREKVGVKPGDAFAVEGRGDTIVLTRVFLPRPEDLEDIFAMTQRRAKILKLRKRDVQKWMDEIRYGKK